MLDQNNTHIKFVPFCKLENWDAKFHLNGNVGISSTYDLQPFSYFAKTAEIDKVIIEDDKEYKILGVRSYGLGVYLNRVSKGSALKMKKYQKAKENHLFWCKVDTKNGAFGIIPQSLKDGLGSTNMTFAEIDQSKVCVNYLQLLFRSKILHSYMDNMVTGTTNRKYIKFHDLLSNVKIPIPSLDEQNALVKAYNKRIKKASKEEKKATAIKSQIESYFLNILNVEFATNKEFIGLQFTSLTNLSVWGVKKLFNLTNKPLLHSSIYPNKLLREIVDINPKTDIQELDLISKMSFIPMECISDVFGEWQEKREGTKLSSKGYTKFQSGDLIWARITPCMQNGKSAIVENLVNGFGYGSTEFHVLRKKDESVNLKYIYSILRLPLILSDAKTCFTGSAGQQRVPKSYLETLNIPIPPIEIQNKIVAHVTNLKKQIKTLKAQAEVNQTSALTEFEQQIFN